MVGVTAGSILRDRREGRFDELNEEQNPFTTLEILYTPLRCLFVFFNILANITVYHSNGACSSNPQSPFDFHTKRLISMCQITACKVLLFVTPAPQLPALPLSQCVPRHSGNIKAKLGDRNGLFEGLYVSQTYHKPSVRMPNLSGNGARQQSTETNVSSMSQI